MLSRRSGAALFAAFFRQFSTIQLTTQKLGRSPASAASAGGRDTLSKRLLSLVRPKRSAVVELSQWKREGHDIRKYELNRIVRELRKLRRYKHALEICEWMKTQEDIKLLPGDYAVHLDLISKVRGINSAEKFFEDLPEKIRGPETCSALLHAYVQENASAKAEAMMERLSECDLIRCCLPYNHMISLYINNGQLEKVPDMIQQLKNNTSPDIVTYNLWLSVCSSKNDVESAEKALAELKRSRINLDWMTCSTLANLYLKNRMKEKAASILKEMEILASRKDRAAFSSLVSLYAGVGDKDGVRRAWKKMRSLFFKASDSEYISMVSSLLKLGDLEGAEKLYDEWESISTSGDARVTNLLLRAYVNSGDNMGKAKRFLDRVVRKGVVRPSYTTWEVVTWGYLKHGQMEEVLDCFEKLIKSVKKWEPDEKLVKEMLERLGRVGDIAGKEKLLLILRKTGHLTT